MNGGGLTFLEGSAEHLNMMIIIILNRCIVRIVILFYFLQVEVKIYGPYPKTVYQNEFLIAVVDPFSKWIAAQPIPDNNHATRTANFVFETFCIFGFAQCSVVGFTPELFETMQCKYKERFDQMQETFRALGHPFENTDLQQSLMFTLQESSMECSWVGEVLDPFVQQNPSAWDQELDRFLFHYRTVGLQGNHISPFLVLFGRNPTGYVSEEDKENINIIEEEKALEVPTKRRRLQSSILQVSQRVLFLCETQPVLSSFN